MARRMPFTASNVRSIKGSRACTSTCTVTSRGMRSRSIRSRQKSKSVCDAEGKPISISLKPISTSLRNMRVLRAASMGSIKA